MKPVPPVVYLKAGKDPREPNYAPPDRWLQMFEEHRELALKSPNEWVGTRYLAWALIACGLVLGVVGVVLL